MWRSSEYLERYLISLHLTVIAKFCLRINLQQYPAMVLQVAGWNMCGAAYSGSASMGGMYRRGRQMPSLVASIPFALLIVGTVSLGFSCAARWVLIVFGTLYVHWVNVYTTQSCCSLNQNTVVMILISLLSASWHHNWVFLLHLEMSQKLRTLILCKSLPEFLSRLLNSCLHQLLGIDEVSGEWLQLLSAIHDEGDGLILREWHSQSYDCTHSFCVWFDSLELFLWSSLCYLKLYKHILVELT
jgi:hypothetical protein